MTVNDYEFKFLRGIRFDKLEDIPNKEECKAQGNIKENDYGIGICKAGVFPMVFRENVDPSNPNPTGEKIQPFRFDHGSATLGVLGSDANKHREYYWIMGSLNNIPMEE